MENHETFIRKAIDLAAQSRARGDKPFGAVLVLDGKIVLMAENSQLSRDPLGHSELNLLQSAWRELPREQIHRSTIYASTEPCAMCAAAIYWSGIRRIVFSLSGREFGKIVGDQLCDPCDFIINRGPIKTEVIGPILEDEGRKVHEGFWVGLT
jgi:tRNA(Arg) A34 adenosine deaminase TadA